MALEQELDGKLLNEFALAQERTQKGKLAIGAPNQPEDEKIGFMPKAIRMGKQLIAEKELAEMDQIFRDSMREYERTANFKDVQTRNRSMWDMKKRFSKVRDTLFTQGLAFQKKIEMEKVDAQSEAFLWEQLGGVAQGLGKAFILYNMKTPTVEPDPIGEGGIRSGQGTILPGDYPGYLPGEYEQEQMYGVQPERLRTALSPQSPEPQQSGFSRFLEKLGF